MFIRSAIATVAIVPAVVLATACDVVHQEQDGRTTRVDISTPLGALTASTGEKAGNTGLPVYPGAQLSRDGNDGDYERAKVSIGTPWFGLRVVAAEYESPESPEQILNFYREQMKPFGAVTECRGDVKFKGGRPDCRSHPSSTDIQLVVGTEESHRIVAIKPRGQGSEFALVSIQSSRTSDN
jgi:hypothetical protein